MKIIVVGSSHSGYEALEELLESNKNHQLQWYERGDYLSFMSWGMHLYLEGIVNDVDSIRYSSADSMKLRGVEVFPNTEIIKVDPEKHIVTAKDLKSGEIREEKYDKLILGIGSNPFIPDIKGKDLENISLFGGRDCSVKLREKILDESIKDVVIVGGGYIGIEAAISFAKGGKNVTIINRSERPLQVNLDKEFTDILLEEFKKHNIIFKGKEDLKEYKGKDGKVISVITDKNEYPADFVISALGSRPATKWLEGVLELNDRGFIVIDDYMRTNKEDIYAVGGATLIKYNPAECHLNINLATNARKQGRIAAKNILGEEFEYKGTQGTSGLNAFDYYFASTGLNEVTVLNTNYNYGSSYIETLAYDNYLPDEMNEKVYSKLYYDKDSHRILGAQIMSKKDLTSYIQAISLAIRGRLTYEDLAYGDFFFQPLFNRPWNLLNEIGLAAEKQEKLNK